MDDTIKNLNEILDGTHVYYEESLINSANEDIKMLFDLIISKTDWYNEKDCGVFNNKLEKKICKMLSKYYPAPSTPAQLGVDKKLVSDVFNEGGNGKIYKYALDDKYIIKGNKQYIDSAVIDQLISETFINFVCINDYIIDTGNQCVVPTYGYFICDDVNICTAANPDSSIFLIQPKIENAQTLTNWLAKGKYDARQCMYIFFKILYVMIDINKFSEYSLIHGDLHSGNILLIPDPSKSEKDSNYFSIKIIDWGMASFIANETRYYNWIEEQMLDDLRRKIKSEPIRKQLFLMSGLYDVFFLTTSFKQLTVGNKSISSIFEKLLNNLFPDSLDKSKYQGTSYLWNEIPNMIKPQADRQKTDEYILSVITELNTYTYESIRDKLKKLLLSGTIKI